MKRVNQSTKEGNMKKRLISFVLVFALVFTAFAVSAPSNVQAKKKGPVYYQKKLQKFVRKHGRWDSTLGEYYYGYDDGDLSYTVRYDPSDKREVKFNSYMFEYDYDTGDDYYMWCSLYFDRGKNPKATVHSSLSITDEDGDEYAMSGFSKPMRIKKFTYKKLKFNDIYETYLGRSQTNSYLKQIFKPCVKVWKSLLKRMGFSFKKIGLKKLK